ncbi:hypothetical protein [Sphingobacterium hotanense]|uniref:hypothetical protein n=1 Tax=Sphingobacterium hotanense TaxID=649196 RepID=UPI0021A448DD|nr:hypothetical protein [Sphingobacterium hotanense]MCT1525317.1 hypothetical protein [Sphingobacterium hotanense]
MIFLFLFISCKKLEHDDGIVTFGEVFFDMSSVPSYEFISVRYNGQPIDLESGTGRIRVPEGEAQFSFYDERTSDLLGEKTLNIIARSPEKHIIFRPTDDAKISFLDSDGQSNEEAPSEGKMKIKIANYATSLLPGKVDIVFHGLVGRTYIATDTIKEVSQNLGEEEYHLVKKGDVSPSRPTYQLSFINSATKEELTNIGGTIFFTTTMSANALKGIYTLYLTPSERDFEAPAWLSFDNKFYTVSINVLYAD